MVEKKILFITAKCSHYHIGFFEELSSSSRIKFLFDSGDKKAGNPLLKSYSGNFDSNHLKSVKIFNIVIVLGFWRLLRELLKANVIIKSDENQLNIFLIFLMSRLFNKKIVFWCSLWKDQRSIPSKFKYFLQLMYLKRADAVICYGAHVKRYLKEKYSLKEKKLYVEHHSTDPQLYSDDSIKFDIRINGKKNLLFVGRLAEEKGLEYLIRAFSRNVSLAHLHIVGNGPLETNLKKIANELKISNNVTFHGFYEPEVLHNFYEKVDIFILPSISTSWITEPWGYVINEALYYGLPVIATKSVGAVAGGLVIDRFNGLVVEEKNIDLLDKAISELCSNESLYITLKDNSDKKLNEWNNSKMTFDFLNVIKSITA